VVVTEWVENFDFYGRVLEGQPQQRERWKRAVQATNAALGEAVGKIYVETKFPPSSKQANGDIGRELAQRVCAAHCQCAVDDR
jgi:putative endopeptidase